MKTKYHEGKALSEKARKLVTAHGISVPHFPFKAPDALLALTTDTLEDPILQQILPTKAEMIASKTSKKDAVYELPKSPLPGLIHKYDTKALLILSPGCHVHCRYCFRRNFPYPEHNLKKHWPRIMDYLTESDVEEIILSGGDPFTLKENMLIDYLSDLASLNKPYLRLHTRSLVMLPDLCTDAIRSSLGAFQKSVVVFHSNHAQELTEAFRALCKRLAPTISLLNQSVLLRGVNDSADTLAALSKKLWDYGITPYYLHQLDMAEGVEHFLVPEKEARVIVQRLREMLPGYLVPRWVKDEGGKAKTTLV